MTYDDQIVLSFFNGFGKCFKVRFSCLCFGFGIFGVFFHINLWQASKAKNFVLNLYSCCMYAVTDRCFHTVLRTGFFQLE